MFATKKTADLLDDAAELLETDGWCRGAFSKGARSCAYGAIRKAATGDAESFSTPAYVALLALEKEVGGGATVWNDRQRDKRKVVRAIRRTARKVRAGAIRVVFD